MKILLLSLALVCAGENLYAAPPKTYAEAQDQLGEVSMFAAGYRKTLTKEIKNQAENNDVLNRITQAKISVQEMIRRDNIAKACKVVEYGFTAATIGVGGIAMATKEGLSVLSAEGAKVAAKYMAGKAAVEAGKETAGVPGYSDSVKVGVYIFNKVDENEVKGQLSRDNIDLLLKVKRLIEDESDGRTLSEKLPELNQMVLDMEEKVAQTGRTLKALDNLIEERKREGALLSAEAKRLREIEKKNAEKEAEKAKKAQPANLAPTEVSRPAEVPPAPVGPGDSPEEKRRKIQESLDKYIKSLQIKIAGEKKAADDAWTALKKPEGPFPGEIPYLLESLIGLEENFTRTESYGNMQSVENTARNAAESITRYREQLERYRGEIKAKIEPLINNLSGYTAQWQSVHNTYSPLGYYVSVPEKVKDMTAWTAYYEPPLKFIESYKTGTDGLEERYMAVASKAAAQKDRIYTQAKDHVDAYTVKLQAYKDFKPQVISQLQKITAELSKKYDITNALPYDFVNEFSYNGKFDLADLEAKVAAARQAFSGIQNLEGSGTTLYYDLYGRLNELNEMRMAPLMTEAGYIVSMADNKGHKEAMSAALKKTTDYIPDVSGTEGWEHEKTAASDLMFGAEEALKYLKKQNDKLVAAYEKAIAGFKANTAKDLSHLGNLDPEKYGAEIQKIFLPAQKAEEEKQAIAGEVMKAPLFGTEEKPLLERTGFWTKQAGTKRDELEKTTAAFWESPQGKSISEARRLNELRDSRETRDPGLAAVRKMYDGFKSAYESRNAAKVMSFIADDWSAGDGSTASDLNEQFSRIFRLFDEIKMELTNLQVIGEGNNMYTASYDLVIHSRIYSKNIKREERSSVYEHVEAAPGTAKIKKTENGGYWSVK